MQLTLRAVRISRCKTLEQVANYCGVTKSEIKEAERDSSEIAYDLLKDLINLYGIPLDDIYIGPCIGVTKG